MIMHSLLVGTRHFINLRHFPCGRTLGLTELGLVPVPPVCLFLINENEKAFLYFSTPKSKLDHCLAICMLNEFAVQLSTSSYHQLLQLYLSSE